LYWAEASRRQSVKNSYRSVLLRNYWDNLKLPENPCTIIYLWSKYERQIYFLISWFIWIIHLLFSWLFTMRSTILSWVIMLLTNQSYSLIKSHFITWDDRLLIPYLKKHTIRNIYPNVFCCTLSLFGGGFLFFFLNAIKSNQLIF